MTKNYRIYNNIFFLSVFFSVFLSDFHFIPGHREAELAIIGLLGLKLIGGYKLSFVMPKSFHEYCFLIFTAYMCLNIVISMIINGVSFHWLLYFLMFLPLMHEAKKTSGWDIAQKKNAITLVVNFLLLSVLIGLISRLLDPGALPITITMLLLPISVFIPFAIFNIKYGSIKNRYMAYLVIILCLFQIMLESSRGALVIYFATVFLGFWAIGFSRKIFKDLLLLSPILFVALFVLLISVDVLAIINDTLLIFGGTAESGAIKDIDRFLNYAAMFEFYQNTNLITILLGTGFRSAWIHVAPYLTNLYDILLPQLDYSKDQTIIGLPNIIVNTGILGFALLVLTSISSIFFVIKDISLRWKLLFIISILGVLARNFGNDSTTNTLFLFVIMPFGVYWFLASSIKDLEQI